MLSIRKKQMDVLEQSALKHFQKGLIPHVRKHFPVHAEYLGDQGVLLVIEHSCAHAGVYGFETERDLCLFTDLSIMIGVGFDTDPQLPWAAAILQDVSLAVPRDRMDMLWDKALEYIANVLGPYDVFPVKAYRFAARRLRLDSPDLVAGSEENTIIAYLEAIWPEKVKNVGISRLIELIGKSSDVSNSFGVTHVQGQAEFTILAFLIGHHFFNDPVYPWAQDILNYSQIQGVKPQNGVERMARLRIAFEKRLDQALLENVDQEVF